MVINTLAISGIIILIFGLTDSEIGRAISGFMMAGIIPGTSYQVPWLVIMIAAPLALLGLAKVFLTMITQSIMRKITFLKIATLACITGIEKKPAASKRTNYIKHTRKPLGTSRSKTIQARKLTQAEA